MSVKHPIISVTGSSGAGTTSVRDTFEQIFRREHIDAVYIEGDAFHRFDRAGMKQRMALEAARGDTTSAISAPVNLLRELQAVFAEYAEHGTSNTRHYVHDAKEAEEDSAPPGTFTEWHRFAEDTDLLLYEGLHGAVSHGEIDIARYPDVKIGVVPVINLEWIQKIHRDRAARNYSTEAVMETILQRMPDYVRYICPQFTSTDINFQRVPTVDTSNPFIARWIPTPHELIVVIRFRNPRGIDFPYLLSMIHGSFMSRANSIAIPGNKLDLAMQLILTRIILQLVERKRRAG